MLALWPAATTLGPLIAFVVLNGAANGGFFSTIPTVVGNVFGSQRVSVAMAMIVTGWGGGYLMVSRQDANALSPCPVQYAYQKTGFPDCWISAGCLRRNRKRISSIQACYNICRMHGTWSCRTRGVCKISEDSHNFCKSLAFYAHINNTCINHMYGCIYILPFECLKHERRPKTDEGIAVAQIHRCRKDKALSVCPDTPPEIPLSALD